ncbi:winged helix DNA-binding protein [Actinacidiphila paucisporea]|uniref:Winged helix DNA-binding domain-containing protein n=1 Tax=Actinacidiphila paucisporea TaxID=310782 RepID=A0A1M7M340_9ACTN|nr:winged helix DNA-binding protein [Actinacidiphila paucisporea]SHM84989.1 Winged helix DNA-binding domain-containing protein [Actinacidiphila paucisporea]
MTTSASPSSTAPSLNPQILGQAENAHAPILRRLLAVTGLGMTQWVALKFTAALGGSADRDRLAGMIADALRTDLAAAGAALRELTDAGLLAESGDDVTRLGFTDAGRAEHDRIASGIKEAIGYAYAGIPAEDLLTAGRVLTLITERLNARHA